METQETEIEVKPKRKMPKKPVGTVNKLDPRRTRFLELYYDPQSATFNNGLQSALQAGFSESYAKQLIARDYPWLNKPLEGVSTQYLVDKAREVMREAVEGKLDGDGKPLYKYKASEFIGSRADKDFTEKKQIDHTSAGLPIQETVLNAMLKAYEDTDK